MIVNNGGWIMRFATWWCKRWHGITYYQEYGQEKRSCTCMVCGVKWEEKARQVGQLPEEAQNREPTE